MGRLRNVRHETFARHYVVLGNASEAYRQAWAAHPAAKPMTHPVTPRVMGYELLKRQDVKDRVEELRDHMAKKADITMDKVLTDLQEALALAKMQAKPNDMINATMSQAKLVGLLRDRIEAGGVGDFDGMENISEILQKVAEEAGSEAALALSKAFGLDKAETAEEAAEAPGLIDEAPPSDAVN